MNFVVPNNKRMHYKPQRIGLLEYSEGRQKEGYELGPEGREGIGRGSESPSYGLFLAFGRLCWR